MDGTGRTYSWNMYGFIDWPKTRMELVSRSVEDLCQFFFFFFFFN